MRYRHVHADSDEWVAVHRNRPSRGGDNGCGCIIAIIILAALLGRC